MVEEGNREGSEVDEVRWSGRGEKSPRQEAARLVQY